VNVPVLFLSARDEAPDRVRGLTLGADDYVTKPFTLEEVVARIRAILRRAGTATSSGTLSYADLEMDEQAHRVRRAGTRVELSPTEYNLLRYLLLNAERVLTRSQILGHVWDYGLPPDSSVVESYISYLRRKLDPLGAPLIKTVRGIGYCLRTD
jgi:two-component system OmpR family response regulator